MRSIDQHASTNLAELRIRAGHSQRSLGRAARVSPRTIANAEHDSVPTIDVQIRIAAVLDVDRFDIWPIRIAA